MRKAYFFLAFFISQAVFLQAQTVYYHTSNKALYGFLDEMANSGVIELNSAIKPYSRKFIAEKLFEIQNYSEQLNKRQLNELNFYLKDFNKELLEKKFDGKRLDLFYYKDSNFTFSLNPILGIQYWSNENDNFYHRWNGVEAFGYLGSHLGIYASLRDNHESLKLNEETYLNTDPGANYKAQYDYSEMRGGITWSWKWGVVGLVKDHFEWGDNNRYPNIFSGKIPSPAQLKINIKPAKWFEFNYIHAWLVSEVTDSSRSFWYTNSYGTRYREVFRPKYIAANMFTIRPFKKFYFSFGNSIIYSDMAPNPAYLIPVLFYKSVDHTLNSTRGNQFGQNSHMFFNISSRNIKNIHLYTSIFIDELAVSRFFNDSLLNFISYKYGFSVTNLIPNTFFELEYTKTLPLVYQHDMPTTTFESNFYNLGHYLKDNAREIYMGFGIKPIRGMNVKLSYILAQKGPDYTSLGTYRVGNPFLSSIEWESTEIKFDVNYQIINDMYVFATFARLNTSGNTLKQYTPEFYQGKTNTFSVGFNVGF